MRKIKNLIRNKLHRESKTLFKNGSWVFFSNSIKVLFIFFKSLIITKALGLKLYGEYLTILAFIITFQAFFNINFGTILIKFGSEYIARKELDKLKSLLKLAYFSSILSISISVILITAFVLLTRTIFGQNSDYEWSVVILSFTLGLSFIDYVSESFLRLQMKFKLTSSLMLIYSLTDIILISFSVYLFAYNFTYFLLAVAFSKITCSLIYNLLAFKFISNILENKIFAPIGLIRKDYKNIGKFISSNYGSRLLKNLVEQGDVLVLGILSTQSEVGIYGIGKKVGYAVLSFIDPFVNAAFPQFAKLIAEKRFGELYNLIKQFSKIILIPAVLILVVAFFLKDYFILFLYGKEFLASSNVFYIILFAALVASISFWNITLLISLNELRYRFKMNVFILFFSISMAYLLIPNYGSIGAAWILVSIKVIESGFGSFKSISILRKQIKNG